MSEPKLSSAELQERFKQYKEQQAKQKRLPGERSNPFDDLQFSPTGSTSASPGTEDSTKAEDGHVPGFSFRLRGTSDELDCYADPSPSLGRRVGMKGLNGRGDDEAALSEALAAFVFPPKGIDSSGGQASEQTPTKPVAQPTKLFTNLTKSAKSSSRSGALESSDHRRFNSGEGFPGTNSTMGTRYPPQPIKKKSTVLDSSSSSQDSSVQSKSSGTAIKGFMVKPRYEPLPPMPMRMMSKDYDSGEEVEVQSGLGIMPLPSPFIRTLRGEQIGYLEGQQEQYRASSSSPTPIDKRTPKVLPTPPESPTNTFKKSFHPSSKKVPPPIVVPPQSSLRHSPPRAGAFLSPASAAKVWPSPQQFSPSASPIPDPVTSPPVFAAQELFESHALDEGFLSMYEIQDELGSGGFGVVCSAVRKTDGKRVAVKFIFKDRLHHKAQVYDWHRRSSAVGILPGTSHHNWGRRTSRSAGVRLVPMEAAVLQYCNHPGIISFVGLYEDETFFYLVQEFHGTPWATTERSDSEDYLIPRPSSAQPTTLSFQDAAQVKARRSSNPYDPSGMLTKQQFKTNANVDSENGLLTPSSSAKSLLEMQVAANAQSKDGGGESERETLMQRPAAVLRRSSHDLFECIEQEGRFSEDDARTVFKQKAVAYLHRNGICHRDIKDENIVIDNNLVAKIIDFGSAVIYDPRKPAPYYDRFFGTMNFASAEIILGNRYQAAPAEIWSLGVLLSIILTGMPPFESYQKAARGYIRARQAVSSDAWDLILGCMELDPRQRLTIEDIRHHRWITGMRGFSGYSSGHTDQDRVNGIRPVSHETRKSYTVKHD